MISPWKSNRGTSLIISYPTAKSDVERLVKLGILKAGREEIRPVYFYSPEIMDIAYRESE